MLDKVFYDYIVANVTYTGSFKYGSAEGITPPYTVMVKISDPERANVLCQDQGDAGEAVFQFSAYLGGSDGAGANAAETILFLEDIKNQIADIKGVITSGAESYRIWDNKTSGVILIPGQTLEKFGAVFDCVIKWEAV